MPKAETRQLSGCSLVPSRAEAGEDCVGVELFLGGAEAVIADYDEVHLIVGLRGLDCVADGADEAVDVLEGLEGFGAVGAMKVLLVVHVDEVDEEEVGFVGGDEETGHAGAEIVVDVIDLKGRVGLFVGGEQALSAEASVEEETFFGCGLAVFGEVVVDAGVDGDGPGDGTGGEAFFFRDGVEGGTFNLLGVPVPGTVELMFRVEHAVAEDAVNAGRDAGDKGGVAGVGDGGIDAEETVGECAALCELVEVGGVEAASGE